MKKTKKELKGQFSLQETKDKITPDSLGREHYQG